MFKARFQTLGLKTQQKWRYADSSCIGCQTREELGEEILVCGKLNYENSVADVQINYDWFYRNEVSDIVKAVKLLDRGMKERQRIVEQGIT